MGSYARGMLNCSKAWLKSHDIVGASNLLWGLDMSTDPGWNAAVGVKYSLVTAAATVAKGRCVRRL